MTDEQKKKIDKAASDAVDRLVRLFGGKGLSIPRSSIISTK
jgi:hypothetical protein